MIHFLYMFVKVRCFLEGYISNFNGEVITFNFIHFRAIFIFYVECAFEPFSQY
jgi:hypothetical protein